MDNVRLAKRASSLSPNLVMACAPSVSSAEMKCWPKLDGTRQQLLNPGDLVVGDNGQLYQLAEEQYVNDPGDFIRVYKMNRKLQPAQEVTGQHAGLVIKITQEEALGQTMDLLRRYHEQRWQPTGIVKERRKIIEAIRQRRGL